MNFTGDELEVLKYWLSKCSDICSECLGGRDQCDSSKYCIRIEKSLERSKIRMIGDNGDTLLLWFLACQDSTRDEDRNDHCDKCSKFSECKLIRLHLFGTISPITEGEDQ